MTQAKQGDRVRVHDTDRLGEPTRFDASRSRQPLAVKPGGGRLIRGFDQALYGKSAGDAPATLVANRPLAGGALDFDIEGMEIFAAA